MLSQMVFIYFVLFFIFVECKWITKDKVPKNGYSFYFWGDSSNFLNGWGLNDEYPLTDVQKLKFYKKENVVEACSTECNLIVLVMDENVQQLYSTGLESCTRYDPSYLNNVPEPSENPELLLEINIEETPLEEIMKMDCSENSVYIINKNKDLLGMGGLFSKFGECPDPNTFCCVGNDVVDAVVLDPSDPFLLWGEPPEVFYVNSESIIHKCSENGCGEFYIQLNDHPQLIDSVIGITQIYAFPRAAFYAVIDDDPNLVFGFGLEGLIGGPFKGNVWKDHFLHLESEFHYEGKVEHLECSYYNYYETGEEAQPFCVILANNTLYSWGNYPSNIPDRYEEIRTVLGRHVENPDDCDNYDVCVATWPVKIDWDENVVSFLIDGRSTIFLTESGELYGYGVVNKEKMNFFNYTDNKRYPVQLLPDFSEKIVYINQQQFQKTNYFGVETYPNKKTYDLTAEEIAIIAGAPVAGIAAFCFVCCVLFVVVIIFLIICRGIKQKDFDKFDVVLKEEEQNEKDTSLDNIKINDSLFEIPYSSLKVQKKIGSGGSSAVVFKCLVLVIQ